MEHKNLYETEIMRAYQSEIKIAEMVSYINANPEVIADGSIKEKIIHTRVIDNSFFSQVFKRLAEENILNDWSFIIPTSRGHVNVPSAFRIEYFTWDMLQALPILKSSTIEELHEFDLSNKILLNILPFVRKTDLSLVNPVNFFGVITRDALCRSFFKMRRSDWISIEFNKYLCKVYTMILGGSIANWYQLDVQNRQIIQFIFGVYFLYQIYPLATVKDICISFSRQLLFPDQMTQNQIFEMIGEIIPNFNENGFRPISEVFAVINNEEHGLRIPRLKLSFKFLRERIGNTLSKFPIYTALGITYVPLFAYLVLEALSGVRTPLAAKMNELKMLNLEERTRLGNEIVHSPTFFNSLKEAHS